MKKIVRTLQSFFGVLKPVKDVFYFHYRETLRKPSQDHFKFLAMMPKSFDEIAIDVGGNIGQSVQAIRMFLPRARIYSFEPNPNLAQFIKKCFRRDTKVDVRAVGLGEKCGTFKLHVPIYRGFVYDALASFDREHASSWLNASTLYFFNPNKLKISEVECRIERLDDQRFEEVAFIKIDVEGFESEVIKGGLETIRRSEPILMIEDFHEKDDIRQLLYELGYRPFRFTGFGLERGESDTSTFLLTPKRIADFALERRILN